MMIQDERSHSETGGLAARKRRLLPGRRAVAAAIAMAVVLNCAPRPTQASALTGAGVSCSLKAAGPLARQVSVS